MKRSLVAATVLGLIAVLGGAARAQDPNVAAAAGASASPRYVISADAGGVNVIAGKVEVIKSGSSARADLSAGDKLEIGDRVLTSADGKAELLLNPGSFVRLGGNSRFKFNRTSLEDLRLELASGSAILEIIAGEDFVVSVATPGSEVKFKRSGVFRIDVVDAATTRLSVIKGRVAVGATAAGATEVKSGRTATLRPSGVEVAKSIDDADGLSEWSKDRAREASKLNAQLQRKQLRNALISSYRGSGWNMYDSFGVWVMEPWRRRWCFVPFGSGWSSPYGWYYSYDLWNIGMPPWMYRDPWWYLGRGRGGGNGGNGGTGSGGGTGGGSTGTPATERRGVRPPFQQVESSGDRVFNRRERPDMVDSPPIFIPSTPVPSAPAPPVSVPINTPTAGRKGDN
ncbi:MAG: FecR domain-containing protein [Pyrinomonadaceae bacterium]